MTTYVCCICMKSIDADFKWEEIVLPQNEDEEDPEIYADDNADHGNIQLTNIPDSRGGPVSGNQDHNSNDTRTTLEGITNKSEESLLESVGVESNNFNWSAIVSTPCGHLFHLGCIHSWMDHLEKRGWEPNCPYCRHLIYNSMDLVPIYPVSFKEYESDEECSLKAADTKIPYSKDTSIGDAPKDKEKKAAVKAVVVEKRVKEESYFNSTFWLSVLLATLTLLFYMGYVFSCLEILDTEDSEENDFDPLFGSTWALLVLLSTLLALTTDLFNFFSVTPGLLRN